MKIHKGLDAHIDIPNAVVTSGTFDGVHLGHQHILSQLNQKAKSTDGESVVITYWPHPRLVIDPACDLRLICDLEEKIELLKKFKVDHVWIIPFNRNFSLLNSSDFINLVIIEKLKTKKLVIGYDHKFGKNREGSFEYLTQHIDEFPFEIEEIAKQTIDELTFSSTLIRDYLKNGEIENAYRLMGHRYSLCGTVVKGYQNGTKIGFPTANIDVNFEHKLIPADGSYAVKVKTHQGELKTGMLNIGSRPTLSTGRSIEVHIFDFSADIYGERIEVEFHHKLRDEHQFRSIDELSEQLALDKQTTLNYFKNNTTNGTV